MVFAMVLAPPQIKMWPEEVDHTLIEAKSWLYHLLTFKEKKGQLSRIFPILGVMTHMYISSNRSIWVINGGGQPYKKKKLLQSFLNNPPPPNYH